MLRDELVKLRAARLHADPGQYLRRGTFAEPPIAHLAVSAQRNPSLIESEKMLDQGRFKALEELGVGHYFDGDALILYALKLLILERWERIRRADKPSLIDEVLG
jgi:hypothetical protein